MGAPRRDSRGRRNSRGSTNRDPREHTISVAFICDYEGKPEAGDDAVSFGDFEVGMVPELELAFDHKQIVRDYRKWLEKKGTYWSTKK